MSIERGPEFGLPQAVIDGHQETLDGGAESARRILEAGGRLGMGGDYGFAWIFYSGVLLIPMALTQVLFPKISELNGSKNIKGAKEELKKVFALYTPIVIAGIAGTLMFSKSVVTLIAPEYLPSLLIFKTLIY